MNGTVYLLHFDRPYRGKEQHYLGWTRDLEARLASHRAGTGCFTTRVAYLRGVGFVLARTWQGGQAEERRLKRESGRRLCPICSPDVLSHVQA